MIKQFHYFKRSESGIAALEFALILPIMVTILIGIIETSRMALFDQKLKTTTYQLADLITQNDEVSRALLTDYTNAAQKLMEPFDFNGTIIFTSVASVDTATSDRDTVRRSGSSVVAVDASSVALDVTISPERAKIGCKGGCVVWQERTIGSQSSRIGRPGGQASLPNDYTLKKTQNVIVVEVYGNYEPMLDISRNIVYAFRDKESYSYALYKPRQDNLLTPPR